MRAEIPLLVRDFMPNVLDELSSQALAGSGVGSYSDAELLLSGIPSRDVKFVAGTCT